MNRFKAHILVVDDDDGIRNLVKQYLTLAYPNLKIHFVYIDKYKGLGTSNASEAKEYFTDIENKIIRYKWDDKYDNDINLSEI